jgi:1-acyl-sn-glycerol-3-phosphate acyltransferase
LAAFVGEQTLLESVWCILSASGLSVEIHFLPIILEAGAESPPPRAELGRLARDAISAVVLKQS